MRWNYIEKPIKDLKTQSKNPRRMSEQEGAQLESSLRKFGVVEPVVITQDNIVIGGHQRLRLLKRQGLKDVGCMQAQEALTEEQLDELTIRLNKNNGSFDFDLLGNGYDAEDLVSWGFSMEELHLEEIPEKKEPPKVCSLTAKFENEDDLRQAERDIACIIDLYASASYKVKIK